MKNLQGDIIALVDEDCNTVVRYTYDAWGKCTIVQDSSGVGIATVNPYRYRGYYYDTETGLYYLQSRYYDPETGRFVNADKYISLGRGILARDMFTYCRNNPIKYTDSIGMVAGFAQEFSSNYSSFSGFLDQSSQWVADASQLDGEYPYVDTALWILYGIAWLGIVGYSATVALYDSTIAVPKEEVAEKEIATTAPSSPIDTLIYRWGDTTPGNLVPGIKDLNGGLSFSTEPKPMSLNGMTTINSVNSTGILWAKKDGVTQSV